LKNLDVVTVRDSMSKSVLENCGLKNVIQTADPAFALDIPNMTEIQKTLQNNSLSKFQNSISTTVYNWLHDSDILKNPNTPSNDLFQRRKIIAEMYRHIINKYDKQLIFLPTVRNDVSGYMEINELIDNKGKSFVMKFCNDFRYIFSLLSVSDILIGMRLHSMIFATMLGIPIVPISYCGKVKSFLELINLSELYLNIEDLPRNDFKIKFQRNFETVLENRAHYSNLLKDASQNLRVKSFENARFVSDLIN